METIGVFLNGSEEAAASLDFGIKEAALRCARLRLISAWEVPQSMLGAGVGGKELYDQFRESAEALVEEGVARAAELAPSVECERRVAKGQPNAAFLEESQGCTLVVAARRRQGTVTGVGAGFDQPAHPESRRMSGGRHPHPYPPQDAGRGKRRNGILTPGRRAGRPRATPEGLCRCCLLRGFRYQEHGDVVRGRLAVRLLQLRP